MQDLLVKVEALYNEMKELTLKSGVSESLYDSVIKADASLTQKEVQDRLTFLEGVRTNQYAIMNYTYRLVPPETWEMYKAFGEFRFPEQIQLNHARKALKLIWKNKYGRISNKDARIENPGREQV